MGANQRSPIMEKVDTVHGELDNLWAAIGVLAEHISPYCTPAVSGPEKVKAKDDGLEEVQAPLEKSLGDVLEKISVLQSTVNDLVSRVR